MTTRNAKTHRIPTAYATTLALAVLFSPLQPVAAQVFNPHRIFTDAELQDTASLSTAAIQQFLEKNSSVLATYQETVNNERLTAAQIFTRVAKDTGISSKFLLAVVEREKGLLRKSAGDAKASDLDWATGYSCFSGGCNDKYKGFFNQVESTAITQNIYNKRASEFPFQVGKSSKTRDGFLVTPKNQATANLYTYTPYVGHSPELGITNGLGGNRLFFNIWQRFFAEAKYPDGLVITDGASYWKIEGGQKRKFKTIELYLTEHQPLDAITASAKTIAAYADGPNISFANNTLVRSAASGQALLLQDGKQRPIVDESALAKLSDFRLALSAFSEITQVPTELLEPYAVGTPITENLAYPQGKLFSETGTTTLWWVQDGIRHPVHPVIAQYTWKDRAPQPATTGDFSRYSAGSPILLPDGTFVKNDDGNYYIISNGERRKITSAELFDRVFGSERRNNAIDVPDEVLSLHAAALSLDYINDGIQDPPPGPTPAPTPAVLPYQVGTVTVSPDTLTGITNQTLPVTVRGINTGSTTWRRETVTLKINNGAPVALNESSVAPGQTGSFSGTLTFPSQAGLQPQSFGIFGPHGDVLTRFAKFAVIKPGVAAEVVSATVPAAVKNTWRPVTVTVKLKNISTNQPWKSQKTALKITGPDGKTSPFYDVNDWIRTDVAAVPINKKTIAPGETGEFKFTLKVKGIKPGTYQLRFALELLDAKKTVLIDGQDTWLRTLRVDK